MVHSFLTWLADEIFIFIFKSYFIACSKKYKTENFLLLTMTTTYPNMSIYIYNIMDRYTYPYKIFNTRAHL